MLKEGRHFAKLADNIYVKVPMSENGLAAMNGFRAEGIKTNCTLIFTANQGLLAAKAGASLLSPFVGRVDDINEDGMQVIRELPEIIRFFDYDSEVLTASVRHPRHVTEAALNGSHIATLPFKVFQQMVHHPLTDKGIVQFKRTGRRPAPPPRRAPRRADRDPAAQLGPIRRSSGGAGGRSGGSRARARCGRPRCWSSASPSRPTRSPRRVTRRGSSSPSARPAPSPRASGKTAA